MNFRTDSPPTELPANRTKETLLVLLGFFLVAGVWNALVPLRWQHSSQQGLFSWQSLLFFTLLALVGTGCGRLVGLSVGWFVPLQPVGALLFPVVLGSAAGGGLALADRHTGFSAQMAAVLGVETLRVAMPQALLLYALGSVCAEILYHLFVISFGTWLISTLLLARRARRATFWAMAVASGLLEASAQLVRLHPMAHPALLLMGAMSFAQSLLGAWLFQRFGFPSAVLLRLTARVIWHIIG